VAAAGRDRSAIPAPAGTAGRSQGTGRRIVAALAVTQTIGYGTLYYSFSVLMVPMATDLGLSTIAVTGALTASVLASAAGAVPVGRWLDRRGESRPDDSRLGAGTVLLLLAARVDDIAGLYASGPGSGS
jgi:MFS family permease